MWRRGWRNLRSGSSNRASGTGEILRDLTRSGQTAGPLVMDAALAAIAIEHGATLCTTDRDFSRFAGLTWTNPVAS